MTHSRTYQLNGVIALALWPIAVTKQINRVNVLGGYCAKQMLLYQTYLRGWNKATHYNLGLLLVIIIIIIIIIIVKSAAQLDLTNATSLLLHESAFSPWEMSAIIKERFRAQLAKLFV